MPIEAHLVLALIGIAFVGGIGITTIGPGGIFVTIALFAFVPLTSAEVAGTAHLAFVATGVVGSVVYLRSGEIRTNPGRSMAVLLSLTSVTGALLGAGINQFVSRAAFGLLLGFVAVAVGVTIVLREWSQFPPRYRMDIETTGGRIALGILGVSLGIVSGLLGIGGPVLAVPALVIFGVPILLAVAAAQVQSVFIAIAATLGYAVAGSVSYSLAVIVGIPLVAGVIVGWRIAHIIDPARLKIVLGVVLIGVGPYIAL